MNRRKIAHGNSEDLWQSVALSDVTLKTHEDYFICPFSVTRMSHSYNWFIRPSMFVSSYGTHRNLVSSREVQDVLKA